jgi:hypothetical protein
MSRYLLVTLLIGLPLSTALAHEVVEGEPVAARVITTDLVEAEYAYELAS